MDEYNYFNIFETKGIEYLITIVFFLLLIPFWIILNRKVIKSKKAKRSTTTLSVNTLQIPQGVFFNKNHTWAHLEKNGQVKVGLDDMLHHLVGRSHYEILKSSGDRFKKGDVLTEIVQNDKKLKIHAPVSGKIIKSNEILLEDPDLIQKDPYGKGWIYTIQPENWHKDTESFYLAEDATKWAAKELDRIKGFLTDSINKHSSQLSMATMQDGGELIDNPLKELPKEIWLDFQKRFLD